tara:strand:+ start:3512 stop:3625 length:114 start_codon:yes stop_codon:yes gene_type:complete
MDELKHFDKVMKAEDAIGISCDGITCKCKDLNITDKE